MSAMRRILVILLVMAMRNASPESFTDKVMNVDVRGKVEDVRVSTDPYKQIDAIYSRVKHLQKAMEWALCYVGEEFLDERDENEAAEYVSITINNLENLKNELVVLDVYLQAMKQLEGSND